MNLTAIEKTVLRTALAQTLALEAMPEPPYGPAYGLDRLNWQLQRELGPRFSSTAWFNVSGPAEKMRYLRAVQSLHVKRLIVGTCASGTKLSHVRLTAEGRELAEAEGSK